MELLSSHTSLRFLDVKGRPNGNGGSSPLPTETDSETFANRLQAAQEGRQEVSASPTADAETSEAQAGANQPQDDLPESDAGSDDLANSLWQDQEASATNPSHPHDAMTEQGGELLGSNRPTLLEGSSGEKAIDAAPLASTQSAPVAPSQDSGSNLPLPMAGVEAGTPAVPLAPETLSAQPWQESLAAWKVQGQTAVPVTTNAKAQTTSTTDFLPETVVDDSAANPMESASKVNALLDAFAQDPSDSGGDWQPEGEALKPAAATALPDSAFDNLLGETRSTPTGTEATIKVDALQATAGTDRSVDMARHEAVMAQVQAKIQPGLQKATIRLNPEELGHIQVEVTVDKGEVRADLRVESKEALQILQRHVPELRALFAQADMELTDFNLQLADQDASQSSQGDSQDHPPSRSSRAPQPPSTPAPVETAQWTTLTLPTEGLNLLA